MSTRTDEILAARKRCGDMARRWLTRCSQGNCYLIIDELTTVSDEELAENCIRRWGLDQPQGDDNDITWFEAHSADRTMLVEAFAMMRSFFTDKP